MNHLQVQQELAECLKITASTVKAYFGRLSGDEPNSLCKFLGIEEEELKALLRLCKIYTGERDNFSKNNFELLVRRCNGDWTTFKLKGQHERFIKLGNGNDVVLPKSMYKQTVVLIAIILLWMNMSA
jgi:hypothetical protein